MSETEMREQFEKWASGQAFDVAHANIYHGEVYASFETDTAWLGWKAAWAAALATETAKREQAEADVRRMDLLQHWARTQQDESFAQTEAIKWWYWHEAHKESLRDLVDALEKDHGPWPPSASTWTAARALPLPQDPTVST